MDNLKLFILSSRLYRFNSVIQSLHVRVFMVEECIQTKTGIFENIGPKDCWTVKDAQTPDSSERTDVQRQNNVRHNSTRSKIINDVFIVAKIATVL